MKSSGIKKKMRKAIVDVHHCVACGCCIRECPKDAITVPNGVTAVVDEIACIGCGKCKRVCPANVITILEVAV